MSSKIVTIGIPVYNEGVFLSETIQSAINQTYKHLRIVVSDNCSTDNSFEIASKFASLDGRITVYKHKANIGVIENFKFLRDNCDTDYFLWLGAHDLLHKDFVNEAIKNLENNGQVVLHYPKAKYFEQVGTLLENANSEIELNNKLSVDRMMKVVTNLANCTALHGVFRTKIIKEIIFDKIGADNLLLFLVSSYGVIEASSDTMYFRRIVRKETQEEFVARMKKYGMGQADDIQQYRVEVYLVHFKHIFNNINLNFQEKMELFFRLRDLCLFRYPQDFTRLALLKYFLFKNVDLKVASMLPVAYLAEIQRLGKRKISTS